MISAAQERPVTEPRTATPAKMLGAEQSVLGGLLIPGRSRESWEKVCETGITVRDFSSAAHGVIFEHIERIALSGQPIDVTTISDSLNAAGELDRAGGFAYLAEMARNTPSASNIRAYANATVTSARDRYLQQMAMSDEPFAEKSARINQFLHEAATSGSDLRSLLIDPIDWEDTEPPLREWAVPGLIPVGSVTGLGGAGGVAKSTLSQQMCTHIAIGRDFLGMSIDPAVALYVTCEDDVDELQRRQQKIAASLGVSMNDLGNLKLISAVGRDMQIVQVVDSLMRRTALFHQLCRLIEQLRPRCVVLDLIPDF